MISNAFWKLFYELRREYLHLKEAVCDPYSLFNIGEKETFPMKITNFHLLRNEDPMHI
jgi:hypothetical protein